MIRYGLSEGTPSEKGMSATKPPFADQVGIYRDVKAALDYISNDLLMRDTKLVVYGQSIGGAVCIHAAATHPDLVRDSMCSLESTEISDPRRDN